MTSSLRPGLPVILGYALMLVTAVGLTSVTRPQLTIDLVCYADKGPPVDSKLCRHDAGVQRHAARLQMLARTIGGLLTIATTAYWSALSDRWGRARLLAICQLGWIFNEALFLALVTWPRLTASGLWPLVVGPAVDGALGGVPAISAIISAYLSDVVPKEALLQSFTLINGTLAIGAALSPSFATLLVDWTNDTATPLRVAIGVHALLLLYCLFVMPESRAKVEVSEPVKRSFVETALHPFRLLSSNRNLTLLAVILLVVTQMSGLTDPLMQYLMYAVGWDQKEIGPMFSLINLSRTFVLMALIPGITALLKPRWKSSWSITRRESMREPSESTPLLQTASDIVAENEEAERKTQTSFDHTLLFASMLIKFVGELILGTNVRASGAVYIIGALILSVSAAAAPCASALATQFVDDDKHGELFGALGVIEGISTTLVGPVIYTYLFVSTIDWYPAFMFLFAASTAGVGAILTALVRFP